MILIKIWVLLLLAIISLRDLREMVIPDWCLLLMLPLSLCSEHSWKQRLLALAGVWAVFLLLAIISAALKGPVPMGMGDIKLFSVIGLISGASGLAASVVISSLLGGAFGALLLLLKKAQKKDQFAFGPFIAIGYALYLASTSAI